MFACVCRAVSEHEVIDAIAAGADTVFKVGMQTGAGTTCGSCVERLEELVDHHCRDCPRVGMVGVA